MNTARTWVTVLAALASGLAGCAKQAPPSTANLPDFSGWWYWQSPRNGEPPNPFVGAPLKPELAARARMGEDAFRQGKLPDLADFGIDQRRIYCEPQRFAGFNGGFEDSGEFLFTPGRLTITNESGLIRRIPLGAALPAHAEESSSGTSVAHWDDQTLVIETIGLHSQASVMGQFQPGADARVLERISLRDPDVMQIQLRITAPGILEAPYDTTLTYLRSRDHVFSEQNFCVQNDPSFDATGRQKLDLTPPTDLPPPPQD